MIKFVFLYSIKLLIFFSLIFSSFLLSYLASFLCKNGEELIRERERIIFAKDNKKKVGIKYVSIMSILAEIVFHPVNAANNQYRHW